MVGDDGRSLDAIGVPVRDSDQTRWLSPDEVYRLIRDGQRTNTPSYRPTVPQSVEATGRPDPIDSIDRLVSFKDWHSPVLAWQSIPTGSVDLLSQMWTINGVAQTLRHPPTLRQGSGFNWFFLSDVTPFDDGILASDGRHAIWVHESGLITAIATVDQMLSWGTNSPPGGPYRINLVALTEMTLEYFRLADEILIPKADTNYTHAVTTQKFTHAPPVSLPSNVNPSMAFENYSAGQDIRRTFPATNQPELDAYQALWRVYAVFKLAPDRVAFAANDRIDTEAFLNYVRKIRL
jgi:hypothetical protein